MMKYFFYLVIAMFIAIGIEFFGIYDVPFLELPGYFQDDSYYTKGSDRQKDAVEEIEKNSK